MATKIVYIREIDRRTFLVFTTGGEGGQSFCLRDYSKKGKKKPREIRNWKGRTVSQIEEMAKEEGNYWIEGLEDVATNKYECWHELTRNYNEVYGISQRRKTITERILGEGWLPKIVISVLGALATWLAFWLLGLKK